MLAYAASRPAPVERRPHPNTMLAIIAAHVAVVAVVMSARMDLPRVIKQPPPTIFWVPTPKDPPPNPQTPRSQQPVRNNSIDEVPPIVTTLPPTGETFDPPPRLDPVTILGGGANVITELPPPHSVGKLGPRLVTPAHELKPPYPASKLITEEEATLRLKLSIDEHGRVTAVDPVGSADRIFLEAARRYLIAHWRYKAATEDGRAVASSMVITLRFQLDG
jgi:protein TonB